MFFECLWNFNFQAAESRIALHGIETFSLQIPGGTSVVR